MKTLFKFLFFIVLLSNCTVYKDRKEFQTVFKPIKKINYFRVINFSDKIRAKDFDGIIFLHNNYVLVKGENELMNDCRFNFTEEFRERKVKGDIIRSWKAYPYPNNQTKVYIEYKEDDYLFIIFKKTLDKKEIGFYYMNSSLKESIAFLYPPILS